MEMQDCKSAATPMAENPNLGANPEIADLSSVRNYQSAIGTLMYLYMLPRNTNCCFAKLAITAKVKGCICQLGGSRNANGGYGLVRDCGRETSSTFADIISITLSTGICPVCLCRPQPECSIGLFKETGLIYFNIFMRPQE